MTRTPDPREKLLLHLLGGGLLFLVAVFVVFYSTGRQDFLLAVSECSVAETERVEATGREVYSEDPLDREIWNACVEKVRSERAGR